MALPLRSGEELIGALDIQSTVPNAFTDEDVATLSILADQVAIAIQNVELFEQAQNALQKAELASKQALEQTWKGFTKQLRFKGYRYDGIKPEALKETDASHNDQSSLLVPVQLRGQTLGRFKLIPSDSKRKWTEDELSIIESTAERLAIALESSRLLEDAQKRAAREALLSDVSAKLSTSFRLDSILRDTVEELGQTFKGSSVTFQLVNPSAPPTADGAGAETDTPTYRQNSD
jgi:GAF domain-containing protein